MLVLKSFAVLHVLAVMFDDCVIKIISSDAELREKQEGRKHSFVHRMNDGRVTGHFLTTCCEKHRKEAKTKDFNLAEEGSFPCKLC